MSITTIASVLANQTQPQYYEKVFGAQTGAISGVYSSSWYGAGATPSGVADTSTVGGIARSSSNGLVVGQIPFYDPIGSANTYISQFTISATGAGAMVWLADRLWDCGANTNGTAINVRSTGTQTISSVAWPARDNNGTSNGYGVITAIEISTALTGSLQTFPPQCNCVFSNGVTGSVSPIISGSFTDVTKNGFYPMAPFLAQGSDGTQSISDITISSTTVTAGNIVLVAFRILTGICAPQVNFQYTQDVLGTGFTQLYNGTVPFLLTATSASAITVTGSLTYSQG